jgi:hypothetical protein
MPISPDQTGEQPPDEETGWQVCTPGEPNEQQLKAVYATSADWPFCMRLFNVDTHALRFTVDWPEGRKEYEVREDGTVQDVNALDYESEDGTMPNLEALGSVEAYDAGYEDGLADVGGEMVAEEKGGDLVMVLDDGETFGAVEGCKIVRLTRQQLNEIEAGDAHASDFEAGELVAAFRTDQTPAKTPTWTVVGVYEDNMQPFAETFEAIDHKEAETMAHGWAEQDIVIAAVVRGEPAIIV